MNCISEAFLGKWMDGENSKRSFNSFPFRCWKAVTAPAFYAAVALLLGFAVDAAEPAPEGATLVREEHAGPLDLRGYGRVSAQGSLWKLKEGQVSLVRFSCQDAESARILGSKYRADLLAYGAVKIVGTPAGLGGTAVEIRHGGNWLLGLKDNELLVASAPTVNALAAAAKVWGAAKWLAVPENAYPRYLDNFDNAGLGIWWMPTTKTPEQMAWMKDEPAIANLHEQSLDRNPAPGVYDLSGPQNAITQLRQIGKPYRHMLWTGNGNNSWLNWLQEPGRSFEEQPSGFTGRRLFEAGGYQVTQVMSPEGHATLKESLIQMMRRQVNNPDLLGWMEPHGEFFLADPAFVPPGCEFRYPAYLQLVKQYSLKTLSEAHTGNPGTYASWNAIPYPDSAYFAGRRGQFLDLDDQQWRWRQGSLEDGEKEGWCKSEFTDADWTLAMRDDMRLLSQWNETRVHPLWYRFSHEIPDAFLKSGKDKIYLHIMPYTEQAGGELTVWVNGKEVTRRLRDISHITRHVQVDVSAALKPGKNSFAVYSNGGRIAYRVFLSGLPAEKFPFKDAHLNRQFLDSRDYVIWEKLQTLEAYLRVMRSVDPVRPIKVMTPHLFQAEAMELFERYGAYPQLTGEGGWYRPMHYKGYSSLRRLPGSSEPGGAAPNAKATQNMFAMIFWESQDCHDYVFDLSRDLWPYKDVVQWWTDKKQLLRTLGKTDFAEFKLGVLRDLQQSERYDNGAIWNWDMSRGPLPSLGLTPVLVDGLEFEKGLADSLPVIIDCATTVMTPAMVDSVRRYVAKGGVFIAQHHSGQHSPEKPDTWVLPAAFGLKVEPKLVTPDNHHKWPLGKIRFSPEQALFPSLRGKVCEGSGVAIDYQDNSYTGAVGLRGGGDAVSSLAQWEDGSMAVAQVRHGDGRFIMLGTPFYLRFRDVNGKWLNDAERQKLVEEMLASLGVRRDTSVGDERVWLERRESKNGLYDTYMACAMGVSGNDWKLEDKIESELNLRRTGPAGVIETTADAVPDVTATFADGQLRLGKQAFSPYQVRQFAVIRDSAGIEGPLHWLEVQRRQWRALTPVPPSLADAISAEAAKIAEARGEAGLDLNGGWRMRRNPANAGDSSWVTADTGTAEWSDGGMGSWLTLGWPETTCAQYRKHVEVPAAWRDGKSRILLGMTGYWQHGIRERGSIWVDGKLRDGALQKMFMIDVTAESSDGVLDLALQVESKAIEGGPMGTLFLRRSIKPSQTIELNDGWTQLQDWAHDGGPVSLPLDGKTKVFGLKRTVKIPADWAGRTVRLVIEHSARSLHGQVEGIIVNRSGYRRTHEWFPIGFRLDRWLKPGEDNEIVLLGFLHLEKDYKGFPALVSKIRLEVQ